MLTGHSSQASHPLSTSFQVTTTNLRTTIQEDDGLKKTTPKETPTAVIRSFLEGTGLESSETTLRATHSRNQTTVCNVGG